MLSKGDLETLAQLRLDDALLLLQGGRSSSAYYLGGYAIELALKACISKLIQPNVIPDKGFINAIYTHRLDSLLSTAGLLPITTTWSEESRYAFWDPMAAGTVLQAVSDPNHGTFRWVKQHW